ncbi:MAG TPA: phytanoyl-CoA dioxygenase family protein [Rhizomicrobium sp.]|nr:phytanoyl-CoA dioxygenase family protein [Rhizomicrobium sp.]
MANLRTGARTLYHWARVLRSQSRTATPVDVSQTRLALAQTHLDLDGLVQAVQKDGIATVPGYWSTARCAEARAELDRIIADYSQAVQVCSNGSDRRMYGVESVSGPLMDFHADSFLRHFGELIGGLDIYNFATLGAHIEATSDNSGSGNGWHRDAHGFQFKAILYLNDTSLANGPFQYLVGSHTLWRAAADAVRAGLSDPRQTRFTDAEIARLAEHGIEQRALPASAGTLLLVNTAGIHRGMPLQTGERYALTNYYYHRVQIDEGRIAQFSPLLPGTAERIRRDIFRGPHRIDL